MLKACRRGLKGKVPTNAAGAEYLPSASVLLEVMKLRASEWMWLVHEMRHHAFTGGNYIPFCLFEDATDKTGIVVAAVSSCPSKVLLTEIGKAWCGKDLLSLHVQVTSPFLLAFFILSTA